MINPEHVVIVDNHNETQMKILRLTLKGKLDKEFGLLEGNHDTHKKLFDETPEGNMPVIQKQNETKLNPLIK